ncbi:glycosyl hydrolase family 8 [Crenothrix polyspora]|uniref:Glucanase n=1 Tax=Crenothrix polyspora TaxID=360316 RepID=A0A1R4GZJ0_9GAMM|nr:glycosyl hydrolase family 8 [Crenothrix polyspora]SJM89406.1 Beta-glucanase [Crenothrix polyspora]
MKNKKFYISNNLLSALRLLVVALLFSMACTVTAGNRPFPQHTTYTVGSIKPNNVTQAAMDNTVKSMWSAWKTNYLMPAGAGKYYVQYNPAGETVSEAHGYGMLLTVLMDGADVNAKTYFDGLYNYYKAHPSAFNPYLMSWKQNSLFQDVEGNDAATDGDMDIAYALLLADKQWGSTGTINYLTAAKNHINAIMLNEVNQSNWTLRLGDWATVGSYSKATRSSDFMLNHLKRFQVATGDLKWKNVTDKTYSIINTIYNNNSLSTGLMPDFVVLSTAGVYKPAGSNFFESANDGKYYWNACRTPWRIATDYLLTGDTRALPQLQKMNSWIKTKTLNNPANVKAGYGLGGAALVTYADNAFTIPFGVSAMVDSTNQTWLNAIWARGATSGTEIYYTDSIKILSMIVMSDNWWAP